MYIRMYERMCVCVYVFMCVSMYVYVCVRMRLCVFVDRGIFLGGVELEVGFMWLF